MTIAREITSAQSGWVYDGHTSNSAADDLVWRYGTERPCNLVGRYVTIFADYSAIAKPYEIALCNLAVLGPDEEVIIPDEVVPIPPTFAEELKSSSIIFGENSSWTLPDVI